jgi:hypothetical protein
MDPLIIVGAVFGALLTWVACKFHYDARMHRVMSSSLPTRDAHAGSIPVAQFDLSSRYDIYCTLATEERLYEGVRILGVRTFDQVREYGAIGGFLELEVADGARLMIPQHGIQMICPTGSRPVFRVLRSFAPPETSTEGAK